jgi:hypothetical protein
MHLVTLNHKQIFVDSPDFSDAFTVTATSTPSTKCVPD